MDPPRLDGKDDDRAERAEVVIMKLQVKDPGPKDFVCVDGTLGADRAVKWAVANLPKDHRLVMVHGIYAPITGWYSSVLCCFFFFFGTRNTHHTRGQRTADSLMLEHQTVEDKYAPMCEAAGVRARSCGGVGEIECLGLTFLVLQRKCSFFSFPYLTKGTFGDTVCKLARYNSVNSVITGRRSELSPLRRCEQHGHCVSARSVPERLLTCLGVCRQFVGSSSMALLSRCEVPVTVGTFHSNKGSPPLPLLTPGCFHAKVTDAWAEGDLFNEDNSSSESLER